MGHKIGWRGTEEIRFWSKVRLDSESGCWEWIGALDGKGYGAFTLNRDTPGEPARQVTAYEWAYEYCIGPIHSGKQLHHFCENIRCVNPFHLEPLTPKEHVAVSINNPCFKNANKTQCKHGHEFTEQNTYLHPDGSRKCRICQRAAVARYKTKIS
jgi:hypothetical protein